MRRSGATAAGSTRCGRMRGRGRGMRPPGSRSPGGCAAPASTASTTFRTPTVPASTSWLSDAAGRKVCILVTDGEESYKTPADVVSAIKENEQQGIETYAIGFQLGSEGRYLADHLGLGKRYFQANKGREGLLAAMSSVLEAIER